MIRLNTKIIPIILTIGICLGSSILFFNYSIGGFGVFVFVMLLLSFLGYITLLKSFYYVHITRSILRITIAHLFYASVLTFCFLINGSMTSEDIRFLLANAINIFWWPVLYILAVYNRNFFYFSFKAGYVFAISMIILSWLCLVLYTGDLFFLRHNNSVMIPLKMTVFNNPNRFARITLIITITIYYFYRLSIVSNRKKNRLLLGIIILSVFIIITTLSRANIVALSIFGVIALSFSQSGEIRINRIVLSSSIFILILVLLILNSSVFQELFSRSVEQINTLMPSLTVNDPRTIKWPRDRTWVATIHLIKENPIFGVGYSSIKDYMRQHGSVIMRGLGYGKVIRVHGGFLQIATYGGLASLVSFLFFYLSIFLCTLKIYLNTNDKLKRIASVSTMMLLLVLIPMNIAADCFGLSLTWMVIAFLFVNSELNLHTFANLPDIVKVKMVKQKENII